MKSSLLIVLLMLGVGSACGVPPTQSAPGLRRNSNLITMEEVQRSSAADALQLVQTLRPAWLRIRGLQSFTDDGLVVVYLDQVRLGGPASLRSIPVVAVETVQFLDAAAATQRWGTGHTHGAILIISPTGRP